VMVGLDARTLSKYSDMPRILASKQNISESNQPQKALQINFIRPAQMSLFAKITCYPPLGEVTCVQRNQRASTFNDGDKVSLINLASVPFLQTTMVIVISFQRRSSVH
jgi:hypothetical protein